jgi:short-subunit dehydrogenase
VRVLIIGGTSGIGLGLARHYAAEGDDVTVCGRDPARVPADAGLKAVRLEITDHAAVEAAMGGFTSEGIDLLVVAAGFYFNHRSHALDAATTLRMLQTNVSGLAQVFELAAAAMLPRRSGHLVAISSVAGLLREHPGASLYSATKRSVLSVCDSYRTGLAPFGITVTAIVPGYVDTAALRALNGGDASHKPFIVSEAEAVARITRAIAERRAVCVFPWQMRWLIAVANLLPRALLRLRR